MRCRKSAGGTKVGVEDGHDFAGRGLQSVLQRAGFVAMAVVAMDVFDGQAGGLVFAHQALGEGMGFVGGIVQHLDLQQVARIIDFGGLFEQPLHHVTFVIDRKLDGDARKLVELRLGGSPVSFLRCFQYPRIIS